MRLEFAIGLLSTFLLVPALASAQVVPADEYQKKIRAANELSALTDDSFGNSTSDATGRTVFTNVDISIPGNNSLPVQLGRRLVVDQRYVPEELGGIGNWDIDVPFIEGTFSKLNGWAVAASNSPNRYKRCSIAGRPVIEGVNFGVDEVSHGYNIHVPGVTDEVLLKDANTYTDPADGVSYPWILKSQARLSCLATLKNGYPGEGFVLKLTDGTKYYFDYPVERELQTLRKGPKYLPGYSMPRKRIFLLASRIEDRFGNYVDYQYTSGKLTGISANDGRQITLQHGTNTITASANGRVWTYGLQNGHLATVTNPDQSTWTYSPLGGTAARPQTADEGLNILSFVPENFCLSVDSAYGGTFSFNVKHPSGAVANFGFEGRTFSRSRVPYGCVIDFFDHQVRRVNLHSMFRGTNSVDWATLVHLFESNNGQMDFGVLLDMLTLPDMDPPPEEYYELSGYARISVPNYFGVFSLKERTVSGPGMLPGVTRYAYGEDVYPYCDQFDSQTGEITGVRCNQDPCPESGCIDGEGRWTEITLPSGDKVRKRHGVIYGQNEGMLLAEQVISATGTLMKDMKYRYYDPATPATQAFAKQIGWAFSPDPMQGKQLPLLSSETLQGGVTFKTEVKLCGTGVYCFDGFARPTLQQQSNTLGYNRSDATEYHDDLGKWVLGQIKRQYNADTGLVASQTDYDAQALPWKSYRFGKLQQTLTYSADGTLATVADGGGNVTALSNWKRGIPQLIHFPPTPEALAGATASAVVDNDGLIASATDEIGARTCYTYDAMGRIASIIYPSETQPGVCDGSGWNPVSLGFQQVSSDEHGLPAGHWRLHRYEGNKHAYTYYDAMWRPVLEEVFDYSNAGDTLSQTVRRYDTLGRPSFVSYPQRGVGSYLDVSNGSRTSYDALGRTIRVEHDSEWGVLATTTEHLDGLRTRVTNPRGLATTSNYMAWGEPDYALPLGGILPEGKVVEIERHARFGWPLRVVQRSADHAQRQERRYVYDGNAQLCKIVEPESGATVMGYDAGGNLAWSAAGLSGGTYDADNCTHAEAWDSGRRVTRSYDALNRLSSLVFPDGRGNQNWTYTPDGLPASAAVSNEPANAALVTTSYTYNQRRKLTNESVNQAGWYIWNIGYSYDGIGNLAWQSYPTGLSIDYAPNALGQATKAGSYASNAQYHPNGMLKQFTYGNGVSYLMQQNERQLPLGSFSVGVSHLEYNYDANGNIDRIKDVTKGPAYSVRSRSMVYDDLDRLTDVGAGVFGGDNWHRFTYDALDNIESWKLAGVKDHADYVYDAQTHRLTSIRNSLGATVMNLGYDAQGNLQSRDGQAYDFDFGNRLRNVPGKERYRYDALGRRVMSEAPSGAANVWQYSQGGQMLFSSSWDGANYLNQQTREHIYLAGSLVATVDHNWPSNAVIATQYHHTDALGSPVAVTNTSGQVVRQNDYEPYGAVIGQPGYSGIGYGGHVMDGATGLTYMQQRYYDQGVGRFLSVDPVSADTATGSNFNRYRYAANNPYTFVDADGRQEKPANGGGFLGDLTRRVRAVGDAIAVEAKLGLFPGFEVMLGSAAKLKIQQASITTIGLNGTLSDERTFFQEIKGPSAVISVGKREAGYEAAEVRDNYEFGGGNPDRNYRQRREGGFVGNLGPVSAKTNGRHQVKLISKDVEFGGKTGFLGLAVKINQQKLGSAFGPAPAVPKERIVVPPLPAELRE
ncbi:RHS repeat-associated protein [Tahibacter aquaticus]|uniref:RHS repeat-associated protein n=1 Tax=Tahibacter aquaticus TaxID=520092 RepID=A0A4V3DL66_9GAMM|nr:RHS repeat domain-containing protein [Tahibacter aquaticus]TDR37865.1 RHS repeat-associated protein [Tahibacter aquaticus]